MNTNLLKDAKEGKTVKIPFDELYGCEDDMYPTFWSQQQFEEWLATYGLSFSVEAMTNEYTIFKV